MLLWANGSIDHALADGCAYFREHAFNVGQHVAHNEMLDECVRRDYDWHIRVDDDCFISTRKWLDRLVATQAKVYELLGRHAVLGITIDGLDNPPASLQSYAFGREVLERVGILGGIFRMSPMSLVRYFRWDERQAMGFSDATQFKNFCESVGVVMLRVRGIKATHGESTRKQEAQDDAWAYEHDMLQYMPLGL